MAQNKSLYTQDDVDAYIARSRHAHSTKPVRNVDTHSTVRSLVPGVPAVLVNVSCRTQGFCVRKGNPKGGPIWDAGIFRC